MVIPFREMVLLLALLLPSVVAASDYRCAERIITVGDSRVELIKKCGQPDWKQSYDEEIVEAFDEDSRFKTTVRVEEWTYNLGPSRFMRVFRLRGGRVQSMRSGDYGYASGHTVEGRCSEQIISVGDPVAEVMMKCGEPLDKDRREEVFRERLDSDVVRKVTVTVEDWTYDSGRGRFHRVITLRNGRVSNIRTTDEYGD